MPSNGWVGAVPSTFPPLSLPDRPGHTLHLHKPHCPHKLHTNIHRRRPPDHSALHLQNMCLHPDHPDGHPLQPPGHRKRLPLPETPRHQQLLPGQPRLRRPLRRLLRHDLQRQPADFRQVRKLKG